MKPLGTILPDAKSLAATAAYYKSNQEMKDRVAASARELTGCTRKIVGGEVRYYDTTDQYAIISRQGKILWFQVRADGDYRI